MKDFETIIDEMIKNGMKVDYNKCKDLYIKLLQNKIDNGEYTTYEKKIIDFIAEGSYPIMYNLDNNDCIRPLEYNTKSSVSGRVSYKLPNMGAVPKIKEVRELFIPNENYKLLGIDASNLELKILSHYLKDEELHNFIINEDFHSYNAELLNIPRDIAKKFIYAYLYGSGDENLSKVVYSKKDKELGKKLREKFEGRFKKLTVIKNQLSKVHKERGFIKTINGREVNTDADYKLLNLLIQSAASDIMRFFTECLISDDNFKLVMFIHDELQIEISDTIDFKYIEKHIKNSIEKTNKHFNLYTPLSFDYKIGKNWSETH